MTEKYNADLAKCSEELAKSITEFENLKIRLTDDIRWFKERLENDDALLPDMEPLTPEYRAKIEQDLAGATALRAFVSGMSQNLIEHSISISDKLLKKEEE